MASKNEEYIAVAAVLISLVVLSIIFGVFWSFLLVFTFLLLAYLFGRPETEPKIFSKKVKIKKNSVDSSLDESEFSTTDNGMDVPFTGLPSPKHHKQALRSPMPLLAAFSTVTKRLSFNSSSFSPRDAQVFGNSSRRLNTTFGSPRQSLLSPITSPQTPKYFSLINPSLQKPSTVKIAAPDVNNRTSIISEPQGLTDSPLSRTTILSALKQSTIRKRSVAEDEDNMDDFISPIENNKKKRRYHYPNVIDNENIKHTTVTNSTDLEVTTDISDPPAITRKSSGIHSLIQTRLKRKPLHVHGDGKTTEESLIKKTRQENDKPVGMPQVTERTEYTEDISQGNESLVNNQLQTSDTTKSSSKRTASKTSYDDDRDSGCDADDDDDIVMKFVPCNSGVERLSKKQAQKLAEKNEVERKRIEMNTSATPTQSPDRIVSGQSRTPNNASDITVSRQSRTPNHTPNLTASRQRRISKKQRILNTPTVSEVTASDSPVSEKSNTSEEISPKKRFTVIRFPSKLSESKRRPVPVYCASGNSPDLPKRQSFTHKITKEDIELDRKLAWQRVQSLLDGSDEDEDQDKSKGVSPSVAIHVTTCMASPSRSQTSKIATTSGVQPSSVTVSNNRVENQAFTSTSQTSTLQPIALSVGSTLPSTLLSLAASKPSEIASQSVTSSQSSLSASVNSKPTVLFQEALSTSSGAAVPTTNTQGFSFQLPLNINKMPTAGESQANTMVSLSAILGAAPVKNLFGTSTSEEDIPTVITSLTTSSQSILTPICTPVIQAPLDPKSINSKPSLSSAPVPVSLNFGSTTNNLPPMGSSLVATNATTNPPQVGLNTSDPPKIGFNIPSGSLQASASPSVKSSLFSGLNASTPKPTLQTTPITTTQTSQKGIGAPGGFSFNQPTVSTAASQASTFRFGQNKQTFGTETLAQNAFGSQTSQSVFGAGAVTTQNTFNANTTTTTTNVFGSAVASTTNAFGSNVIPATNTSKSVFGPSTASSTPAFGFASTNSPSTFGNAGLTGTPGGFKFGSGTATAQNVFGRAAQPTTTSSAPSGQFSFTSASSTAPNQSRIRSGFSFAPGVNSTSTPQTFSASSSQSAFGAGTTKNVFGATVTQSPFGAFNSQNAFGSPAVNVPATQTSQNAFTGSTTQSTFAIPPTQNVFGNPGTASTAGGFSFTGNTSSTSSTGGFNFGAGMSSGFQQNTQNAAPAFGSTPSATPAAPTGGFNFSAGGTPNAPAFGAAKSGGFSFGSAPQTSSSSVARPRPKATAARRRLRK